MGCSNSTSVQTVEPQKRTVAKPVKYKLSYFDLRGRGNEEMKLPN